MHDTEEMGLEFLFIFFFFFFLSGFRVVARRKKRAPFIIPNVDTVTEIADGNRGRNTRYVYMRRCKNTSTISRLNARPAIDKKTAGQNENAG